ncbi:hypothetical protein Tco_0396172 [Tanacetum coccineum]
MQQEVTRMVYKEERWQQEWQGGGVRSMTRIGVAWTTRSARSCVMQCTLPTQWMRSFLAIGVISPEGFLPSILMLVVIIVTVVIVTVFLVVVVVDDVSPILKLLFVIIGFLYGIVL